ncbi:MAG: hypothetical protein E7046_02935 [Lentisphaerae bacterium]|nr:hypothetical protein [Lentisphaerota bacterium]
MNRLIIVSAVCLTAVQGAIATHEIAVEGPLPHAEEGLIIGNGDLSCSIYQEGDETVFRLGKGDVWDRRVDYSTSPKPPTHDEFVRGLLDDGWRATGYFGKSKKVTATRNLERAKELLTGAGHTTSDFPYPCPKPTGELRMRFPLDAVRPAVIRQRVVIEENRYLLDVSWKSGERLSVEAVIPPGANVLSLKWKIDGWDPKRYTYPRPPVTFAVRRRADVTPQAYSAGLIVDHSFWNMEGHSKNSTALPPPVTRKLSDGRQAVEQAFPADPTFPDGFTCRLTAMHEPACWIFAKGGGDEPVRDANIIVNPDSKTASGVMSVAVTTSSDKSLDAALSKPHDGYVAATRAAAANAWALSGVSFPDDKALEDLWYATYHVRRCVLRSGTVPPGLFLPSTVREYSLWHGDYHGNYNFQSIYWGGFEANRLDEMRTCLDCTQYFLQAGRLRAEKYYGMRGAFCPLQGFPIKTVEDYSAGLPFGRMTYMTGWMAVPHWQYYLYTLDREFLKNTGYPAIRDCALFCLDFLKKAPSKDLPPDLNDGLYHAFPSIDEEGPIRSLKDVTDGPEVIAFTRYALTAAIQASKVLDVDAELRAQWTDRLDNLAGVRRDLKGYAHHCYFVNSPEFGYDTPVPVKPEEWKGEKKKFKPDCYFGCTIRKRIMAIRCNRFNPGRDFDEYRKKLDLWAHPNGLVWGMALQIWGRAGGWTETLSCMAPLQEMMLQSWDGAIRLFPFWPKERMASFRTFRAQGAFLVSAAWRDGGVRDVEIISEKGALCRIHGDWSVTDAKTGFLVDTSRDEFGRLCFKTVAGGKYRLEERKER